MAMPKRQEYQNSLTKVALIKFLIWLIRSDCWHLSFSINPPTSWQQPSRHDADANADADVRLLAGESGRWTGTGGTGDAGGVIFIFIYSIKQRVRQHNQTAQIRYATRRG